MNNQNLIDILTKLPGTAKIYREADHGQAPEKNPGVYVGVFLGEEFPYIAWDDEIDWMDIDDVAEDKLKLINCILIG